MILINLNSLSDGQRSKMGLKLRPLLEMDSIEDMFCPACRNLLKPVRRFKNFRSKGKKFSTYQLVAWCYSCDNEFDVKHWIEVIFRRREIGGLSIIIEDRLEYAIYPQVRYMCKKCDKGKSFFIFLRELVPPAGIGPAAHGLGIHCSIH